MRERQISLIHLVASLLAVLACARLLVQSYILHITPFVLLGFSSFKSGFELFGVSSLVFLFASCYALTKASSISRAVGTERKKLSYIWTFLGTVLMFFSFGLSFISRKPGLEW